MKIIKNERMIFCDVDDTLVMHKEERPGGWDNVAIVPDRVTGKDLVLLVNTAMVKLVREEKHRGATIVVWSRGGYEWAADVVTALGLEDVVELVMSKPLVYFDDKPVQEWLTDRVYLPPTAAYKNHTYKA